MQPVKPPNIKQVPSATISIDPSPPIPPETQKYVVPDKVIKYIPMLTTIKNSSVNDNTRANATSFTLKIQIFLKTKEPVRGKIMHNKHNSSPN